MTSKIHNWLKKQVGTFASVKGTECASFGAFLSMSFTSAIIILRPASQFFAPYFGRLKDFGSDEKLLAGLKNQKNPLKC